MQIIPAGSFNPASLTADDLYIQIQNPPGFVVGVPTDVIGLVGTAGWGPVNQAVHMGSPFDAMQAFGPISAASLTDPYDMPTDLAIAFGQASGGATIEGFGVRVTDGTDVAASGSIAGAATSASITGTSASPAAADTIALTFTSSAIAGSPLTITYTVPNAPTATTVAAGVAALINATAALAAVGIYANSLAGVVSVYQPTALSPQATVSRVVTGTGTFVLSTGAAVTAGLTLSGIYTGTVGNALTATLQAGAASNTTTATIALPTLGISEIYPNLPNATFFAALAAAVANGLSGVRGPSQIVRASAVNVAVGAPTVGTYTFSGGTDGRAGVVTANLLGSNTAIPPTGLYALQNATPSVGIAWIVGSIDPALPASLAAFGNSNGISTLFPFPAGTSTATAVAQVQSLGVHSPAFGYVTDWCYFFDPINNVTRLVTPLAFIGGLAASLSPEQGVGNKPVAQCLGTTRNNPLVGSNTPYSSSEIGQLESAGVLFISNPIPAGAQFGTRHGQITSLNPVTAGMEYWRMTSFLARSFGATMGQFVNQLQSQQPNDPLRNQVRLQLNNFLNSLRGSNGSVGIIDDYSVVCQFSTGLPPGNGINTPGSIAAHYLYVLVKVRYLSVVRFFILSLQGGTTVVTVGAGTGQELTSNS